jgi:hypothetical protein
MMRLERYRRELEKMLSGVLVGTKEDFARNCAALASELENREPETGSEEALLALAFREIQREMERRFRQFDGRVLTLGEHLRQPLTTHADREADAERARPKLFKP